MASADAKAQRRTGSWIRDYCPSALHVRSDGFHRLPDRLLHRIVTLHPPSHASSQRYTPGQPLDLDLDLEDETPQVALAIMEAIVDTATPSPPAGRRATSVHSRSEGGADIPR